MKETTAVWATDQPNHVALLVSLTSFPPKCLLSETPFVSWDVLWVIVCFPPTISSSFFFFFPLVCVSPPGLHGPLKPLLLHRRNSDSATQRNPWLKPYLGHFKKHHLNELFALHFSPPPPKKRTSVSVYQKCDMTRLKWQETHEIPLFGHDWPVCHTRGQRLLWIDWWFSFWVNLWRRLKHRNKGSRWCCHRATSSSEKRKKASTLLDYACMPTLPHPWPFLCIVYSNSLKGWPPDMNMWPW